MSGPPQVSSLQAMAKRWWLVAPLTALGAVIGLMASSVMEPVYRSTTSILVGQLLESPTLTKDDIEASQQLALSYADLIRRQPILEPVASSLALESSWQDLRNRVGVSLSEDNPQLMVVTAEADSPEEAASIAEEIADQLIALKSGSEDESVSEIQGFIVARLGALQRDIRQRQQLVSELEAELAVTVDPIQIESLRVQIETGERLIVAWQDNYSSLLELLQPEEAPNHLEVLEEAELSPTPVRPNVPMNGAISAGVGFFVAAGLAHLLELRGTTASGRRLRRGAVGNTQRGWASGEDGPEAWRPKHAAPADALAVRWTPASRGDRGARG